MSHREPTDAELVAIEAEWPVIEAELVLLDEEIKALNGDIETLLAEVADVAEAMFVTVDVAELPLNRSLPLFARKGHCHVPQPRQLR